MADQCIPVSDALGLLRFQAFIRGLLSYFNDQADCSSSDCSSTSGVRDHIVRRFESQELISWFGMALVALMALYFTLPHQQRQITPNRNTNQKANNHRNNGPNNNDRNDDDGLAN